MPWWKKKKKKIYIYILRVCSKSKERLCRGHNSGCPHDFNLRFFPVVSFPLPGHLLKDSSGNDNNESKWNRTGLKIPTGRRQPVGYLQAWPRIWIQEDREQIQQVARVGLESGTTWMTSLTSRPLNRGTGDLVPHGRLRGVDVQMGCIDVGS